MVSSLRYADGGGPATVRLYNASASQATAALLGAEGQPLKMSVWRDERWDPASDTPITLPPFGTAVVRY